MARLFMAGAEIDGGRSTAAPQNTGPDGLLGGGTVARDTVVFRSGLASWKCGSAVNETAFLNGPPITFVDGRTYFLRGYFRIPANPGVNTFILALGGATTDVLARILTNGTLVLFVGGGLQGSASVAITDSNWHRVELKGVATATGNWTAAELLVDGVSVATWTGTQARAAGYAWGMGIGANFPGAGFIVNVDDVALNDSTGAANNTYPGDGKVVLLTPTADSAVGTGWTDSGGASVGLWQSVDNTPPVGIPDTTASAGAQIRNATSNANVNYDATMKTYTAAGIAAGDTVNAVQAVVATAAPVTTSAKAGTFGIASNPTIANVSLGVTGTAGAFWAGLAAGGYGQGWKWSFGTVQDAPTVTLGTAPVARLTQVTSSTRIAMCCFMGIYVDYTPAGAAPAAVQPRPLIVGQAVQGATR